MSHRLSYVPWSWSLLLLRGLGGRLLGRSLGRRLLGHRSFHRRLLGERCLLRRRRLLGGWLLRRLLLGFAGLRLLRLDHLRRWPRHLGLRGLLAVGEDLSDTEQSQILAMPLLAAVVLAPLLLEHNDLVAARLLHHFGCDQRAGNERAAGLGAIAAKQQHLSELDDVAGLARDALDRDNVVRRHAILLAAHANDREHVSLS